MDSKDFNSELMELVKSFAKKTLGIDFSGTAEGLRELSESLAALHAELDAARERKDNGSQEFVNERLIADLLNSAPDGIVGVNEAGSIVLFNDQAELLFGYRREEIIGCDLGVLMPTDVSGIHDALVARYFASPAARKMGSATQTMFGRKKNGAQFPVDVSLSIVNYKGSKIAISAVRDISENRRLYEDISNNEKKLKKITSVIPAIVFQAIVSAGRIIQYTFFSDEARVILGLDPRDVYNDSTLPFSRIHPEDIEQTREAIRQSNETGAQFSIIFRTIMDDGTIKWMKVIGIAEKNTDGSYTRTGCYIDITESRNLEKQLEDSLLFNRNVLDSLTSLIGVFSITGEIVATNQGWDEFVRLDSGSFLEGAGTGVNIFHLCEKRAALGDHNATKAMNAILKVMSRETEVMEIQYSCGVGQGRKWYLLRIMGFNNHAPYVVVSHRDISDIKSYESELIEAKGRYKALLDTTDEMINTVSLDGKLIWANQAWKSNMLFDDEELKNLRLTDLLTDETKVGIEQRMQLLRDRKPIRDLSGSMLAKDGSVLDVKGTIVPYIENGMLKGTQGFFRNITEIKKVQAERLKIETRLSRILDNMLTGCIVVGSDWCILYINATAAGNAFLKPEAMMGHSIFELFPGIENTELFRKYLQVMQERTVLEFEEEYTFSNGVTKWFELVVEPVDEGLFVMSVDITDKKAAENDIRRHQALLGEAQRIAHLGSWELDLKTGELLWSEEVFRIFEIDQRSFGASYDAFLNLVHPSDRELVNTAFSKSVAERLPYDTIHRLLFPGGRIKYVHEQCETFYDESGQPLRSVGTVHDVTEQKEAEMLLQKNEHKYAQVVENISDGIMVRDSSGNIFYWNSRFLELFCLQSSDMQGLNFIDLVAEEHRPHMAEKHQRRFAGEKVPENFEFLGLRKDGQKRWFDVRVTANEENGKIESVQAIVRDITERKEAEEILESQYKELKKINAELDRFVYSTSHDLRAPLLSFMGLIDLCRESADPAEINGYFEMMHKSAARMDHTIKEILAYSRNSRTEISFEPLDIRSMVDAVIDSLQHIPVSRPVEFILHIDDKIPFVSDRLRIGNIINNLISNAVKYQRTEEMQPFVSIRFFATFDEGVFTIEDNGEGISEEYTDKIFEMFVRHSEKSEGSGLGLYICKEIVTKMGGTIIVQSVPGSGSVFEVRVPNNLLSVQ